MSLQVEKLEKNMAKLTIEVSAEELDKAISEAATAGGYATVEEFMGENTKEEYREYYMFEDTIAFLVENAVITVE